MVFSYIRKLGAHTSRTRHTRTGGKEKTMEDKKDLEQEQTQDETEKEVEPTQQSEPQGTDWKAEAKKWEKRSKANETKARKWDAAQKDAPTIESMAQQIEELKADAEKARKQAEYQTLLSNVSQATGIPAQLIKGTTEEEMTQSAQAIAEYAKSTGAGFPQDKGGGAKKQGLTRDEIAKIKDPVARVKARAENINLYN